MSTDKTTWNLRENLLQLLIRACRGNFWNVIKVRPGHLKPHMGTEFGQLLGVASNKNLCWERAEIRVIWEKLEWGKKWEVKLPGCYLTS